MSIPLLPTSEDLKKITMRGVLAYAARIVRNLTVALRSVIDDATLDDVLVRVDTIWATRVVDNDARVSLIRAAQRVAAAYAAAPEVEKSLDNFRIVFSLTHLALSASHVAAAIDAPDRAHKEIIPAVREAERAVRGIRVLEKSRAIAAAEAAWRDYEIILREYGRHEDATIGSPVECFG
jgi:hypothetical protein